METIKKSGSIIILSSNSKRFFLHFSRFLNSLLKVNIRSDIKYLLNTMITIKQMILLSVFSSKVMRRIILLTVFILISYYLIHDNRTFGLNVKQNRNDRIKTIFDISSNVHIVDLYALSNTKFQCIKTKKLLRNISTNICLHQTIKDLYVSGAYHASSSIWEERQVTRILQLLIRHPHLDFIDIGANIGSYTMYVAALGRFVLAIDCFAPNLVRLRRAIQLTNVIDRVVLVQNALFTQSGQSLRLSVDTKNIGGQGINPSRNRTHKHRSVNNLSTNNPYIVKTITFDEVLPILLARGVRGALMKMDIEGSESFVVENGSRVFDTVNIPFVQMEWKIVRQYDDRVQVILNFFNQRNYHPMTRSCQLLNSQEHTLWPEEIYWLKGNASNFC
jgi:FkbM family methyltransferase